MKAFTVEWTLETFLTETSSDPKYAVPVVRLAEVDALLKEAVWAMEIVEAIAEDTGNIRRARAFLASPVVKAWRGLGG